MSGEKQEASLYVHIPFCKRKCPYCHFYVIGDDEEKQKLLVTSLVEEWSRLRTLYADKQLVSLYFGGGTPILLGAKRLAFLIEMLTKGLSLHSSCEITVEGNPEEISLPFVQELAAAGVNRLSLGLQTDHDTLLHTLGRRHSGATALGAVEIAAAAGITNLSVDLMYDLPDQTLELWEATLATTVALPIRHLSLYNLTLEVGTPFYRKRHQLTPRLPGDEESSAMLTTACHFLKNHGFDHYEVSAFAKPGFFSRHNIGYWTYRPCLGLGPSAFSYWQGRRYRNVPNFQQYCHALKMGDSPIDFSETLDPDSHIRERLAVNLRLLAGVDLKSLGTLPSSVERTLHELVASGLLYREEEHIRLTERGLLLYDTVAVALM